MLFKRKPDKVILAGLVAERDEIIRQTKLTCSHTYSQEQALIKLARQIAELRERMGK